MDSRCDCILKCPLKQQIIKLLFLTLSASVVISIYFLLKISLLDHWTVHKNKQNDPGRGTKLGQN